MSHSVANIPEPYLPRAIRTEVLHFLLCRYEMDTVNMRCNIRENTFEVVGWSRVSITWYTDGSRTDSGTWSGIYGQRPNRSYCFPLGKFATVFQTEIYAILQCEYENIRRAYKNKQILIYSDSQAALKALSGPKVTSRLVAECLDALFALASLNEVTLVWVPRHQGILGNEQSDKLARQASALPILGPEPALRIPKCLAREAIKNWTKHQHFSTWKDTPGCRNGKLFIGKPRKKRTDNLLKLGRHQVKMVVAILTGHAPVRGCLLTMGLFNGDPSCRFCGMETETVQHITCCCESLTRQRYNVLGELFLKPKEISTASVRDLCLFIRETGLLNLWWSMFRVSTISLWLRCFRGISGRALSRRRRRRRRSII